MNDLQNFMAANQPSNSSTGILTPYLADIKELVEAGYSVKDIQKYINEVKQTKASYQIIRYQVKKIEAEVEEADHKETSDGEA